MRGFIETAEIVAPIVLSASRETDIPAFYAEWFVERLREGWCEWKNNYNGVVYRVSFDKVRMIVFWSKNPKPLLERLDEIEGLGFRQYYFQFTLNDYVSEGLEPNAANLRLILPPPGDIPNAALSAEDKALDVA